MPDDKPLRCDCGYRATAIDEAGLTAEIRRHAREAHGVEFTVEDALLVVLRAELGLSRESSQTGVCEGRAPEGGST
jgi:predicted small metal-binding protein